jgi:hypothetical protein
MIMADIEPRAKRDSRNGPVIDAGPVTTIYSHPMERVLFYAPRNANPFFHLMESMWMLAGREDVKFLEYFNSNIGNYSDDGVTFHGAYGKRIMDPLNQLNVVAEMLEENPDERRAVVQIWDWRKDLDMKSKDIPCNDMIFFKVRDGKLDMTVLNRSNDMIWGAYGANAVHFSFFQEYVALAAGYPVGTYRQVSDSLHVYLDNPVWVGLRDNYRDVILSDQYETDTVHPTPMLDGGETLADFNEDLNLFFLAVDQDPVNLDIGDYSTKFFRNLIIPAFISWSYYKNDNFPQAHDILDAYAVGVTDWSRAMRDWLLRVEYKRKEKEQ